MKSFFLFALLLSFSACTNQQEADYTATGTINSPKVKDTVSALNPVQPATDSVPVIAPTINVKYTTPDELVDFAETLIGVPYVYASSDPKKGFDCSGFITYVFSHFNITVPRSSVDFTYVGKTIPVEKAKRGDIILFTGTNSMEANVGHMGIVVSNDAKGLQFIHSTSGKAMSVTISPLNEQYKKRFVRISRLFS